MTQKERIDMLEKRVETLEAIIALLTERNEFPETTAKPTTPNKVVTTYGPAVVQNYIRYDEDRRARGIK